MILGYELGYVTLIDKVENQLIGEARQRGNALIQINELRIEELNSFASTNEVQDLLRMYDLVSSNKSLDENIIKEQKDKLRIEAGNFHIATGNENGFDNIRIIDKKGIVIFSSDESLVGKNISQNDAFTKGLKSPKRTLESYNGNRVAVVVSPIHNTNKDGSQILGVIMGNTRTTYVDNILLNREGLGNSGESYLVNFDKVLITPSRFTNGTFTQKIDTFPVRECIEHGISINQQYLQDVRNPENMQYIQGKGGATYGDYRGIPVLGASYCMPNLGQVLLVEMDKKEALLPLETLQEISAISSIILICGIIGTTYFITRNVVTPITRLQKMSKAISSDDYNSTIGISSNDEIGELARQFEKMRQRIKFVNSELQTITNNQAREIELATERIEKDRVEIEKSVKELSKIKDAIDKGTIMAITDKYGTITEVNKKFCEISKYSEEELIGQNHRILKSGYHLPEFYKDMWKTISSGKIWVGEIKNKAKDGTFYWVTTTIIPQIENGEIVEYISFRIDITHEKELQEKLAKNQEFTTIGELSARIAHDIRNPLSVIQNTVDMLVHKDKEIIAKHKESIERIKRANTRIAHQVDDVLDYVRPKPLILREDSINRIINSVIDKIKIPDGIVIDALNNDISITCDPEKMEIVFVNLIMNAIQAIGRKGDIIIRCIDEGENISIKVTDTGQGISEDILPKIFDPLFTTRQIGTGLGLVSCKNIVERHGGKIHVATRVGYGTTFTVTLPKKPKSNP